MKAIWLIAGMVFFSLLNSLPVYSESSECLEIWNFWSDHTRHQVNLETGEVISYDGEYGNPPRAPYALSPDGRYDLHLDSIADASQQRLTLTDNRTGITTTLSEQARGQPYWSDDSQWLAYLEADETSSRILTLYHVESAEFSSVEISTSEEAYGLYVAWSSDASQIVVSVAPNPAEPVQLLIYSFPQLAMLQQYEASWSLNTLVWSPSGRYLGITGMGQEVGIIDTVTGDFHTVTLDGFSSFHPEWSPDETYFVVHFTQNDFHDNYNFIDPQGNVILSDLPAERPVEWLDDHSVVATLWTETGFSDLVLLNLEEGEQRVMLSRLYHYALSSDARYVAASVINGGASSSDTPQILFFDLSQSDAVPDFRLTLDMAWDNFIWRTDALELLVLFEDRSLQSYHVETGDWQRIASIPSEEWHMQVIACHSNEK